MPVHVLPPLQPLFPKPGGEQAMRAGGGAVLTARPLAEEGPGAA